MKYKQPSISSAVRFQKAPISGLEFSRMSNNPRLYTTYNAGDIVPIFCEEVLPHSTWAVDTNFVNRLLSATIKPTMGSMQMDIYAFFVQNRVVNESWKNVQGENTSGYWSAPEVQLAPLSFTVNSVQIPVGSVADYYGLPTQRPIVPNVLKQMNELKYRGYLEIYNNYFRDQNYQPPISYSKLNVNNGFLMPKGSTIGISGKSIGSVSLTGKTATGEFSEGAIVQGLVSNESQGFSYGSIEVERLTSFSILDKPLKANKLHDYFTSALPSPQKGNTVYFGLVESAPVIGTNELHAVEIPIQFEISDPNYRSVGGLVLKPTDNTANSKQQLAYSNDLASVAILNGSKVLDQTNLVADLSDATGVSVNDLRIAAATQQVYEILARSGSRYLEGLRALFGIEAENPFADKPIQLGHIRRELDLFQVAQTSSSADTPQGNLSGFGYTAKGGNMFNFTALEHGYIHMFAVVRHRNIYSTYLSPDNFRLSTLDFYLPPLANIGEQPLRKALLNPFVSDAMENSLGFQEAWAEYRYSPDRVSGYCRTGVVGGLDIWTYADSFDESFSVINGDWLYSNSQEVLDRTLAVTSAVFPQFIAMFEFKITKQLPMPIYSVPGMDIL